MHSMNEWLIALLAALIGAGAALGGSVISARSTREAGERQAAAALEALRLSTAEQWAARVHDQRRQAYVRFLEAVGAVAETRRTGEGRPGDRTDLQRAHARGRPRPRRSWSRCGATPARTRWTGPARHSWSRRAPRCADREGASADPPNPDRSPWRFRPGTRGPGSWENEVRALFPLAHPSGGHL